MNNVLPIIDKKVRLKQFLIQKKENQIGQLNSIIQFLIKSENFFLYTQLKIYNFYKIKWKESTGRVRGAINN